jgi:hypothetical protein
VKLFRVGAEILSGPFSKVYRSGFRVSSSFFDIVTSLVLELGETLVCRGGGLVQVT